MNNKVTYDDNELSYNVPAKDARVYRITKNTNTGIEEIEKTTSDISIKAEENGTVSISADKEIKIVAIYNANGTLLSKSLCNNEKEITLPLEKGNNIYIIKTMFADGSSNITKYK